MGWLRRGAQVPPDRQPGADPAGPRLRCGRGRPAGGHPHPRRHGLGRHLRPPRRRLRPLLGRRAVDGAALREDALRPGAAGTCVPARLAGDGRAPVPPGARRDHRLRAARPAPPERRVLLRRGRRLPRRQRSLPRGSVLRVDAGAAARGARRRPGRRGHDLVRRHRGRQLRGRQHPPPARARRPPATAQDRAGPVAPLRGPRATDAPRPRRQGAHRVERPDARHAGRGRGRHRRGGLARRSPGHRGVPPARAAPSRRPLAALLAGRRHPLGRLGPPGAAPGAGRRLRRPRRRLHGPG